MKIGLAHKRLDSRGGTELDFYRTAIGLRDRGHEIHLFCSEFAIDPPPGVSKHVVPVLPLGRTARLWSYARTAPKIIDSWCCDLVINFGRMISQDILRSGGGSHRGFLQRLEEEQGKGRRLWHGLSPYHRSLLALERQQFRAGHYRKILAVSGEVKRELSASYGVPESKIAVIHNGVDERRFHPGLRDRFRDAVREECKIPLDAPVVLFVGSGFRRKGLDRLLRAWNLPAMQDAHLIVVGADARLGGYKAMAERHAKGRVSFVGRREDVERYYGAADAVALPSIQEAFGNVVLESLAVGLPVVVSETVGAAEILKGPLIGGIVADPDDPGELVHALRSMLAPRRARALSAEARKLAEDYSWAQHFAKLDQWLKEIVEQAGCVSSS